MFRGIFTTGGRSFFTSLLCLVACGLTIHSHAYTLTQTQSGRPIRWHYGQKYFLAGNPGNQSGVSTASFWNAVVNGLQQWKLATASMFDFDYWQGTNPAIYETRQVQDGLNSIFFASQSNQQTDPNVIGFTQVWYNSNTGDLIEADIILNDRDYTLTDTPTDTSSHTGNSGKKVYINNVITHEIGHAIGLSHSNSINAAMLYVEFSEQFKLGCDDWTAAKHLYPTANNGMGSMTGTILSPAGEPVAGAVITAISMARGLPIASVLTDQNGVFNFGALESGSFSLIVEKYQGTPSSVPPNMRVKSDTLICSNNQFPKNFVTENDSHTLKQLHVEEGKRSELGAYHLRCEEVSDAGSTVNANPNSAMVDKGDFNTSKTYSFNANGPFKITGLGYLLLSPVKVSLSVLDAEGNPVSNQRRGSLYSSKSSEYKIEDTTVSGTAFGPVTVKVEISNNEVAAFPSPAVWPSTSPYFVLIFGDPSASTTSAIPNNARCESNTAFPDYQSPAGNPIRNSTVTSTREGIGFCGNAYASSFHEGYKVRSAHSATLEQILGWMFPFLTAIVCQLFLHSRRAKLRT